MKAAKKNLKKYALHSPYSAARLRMLIERLPAMGGYVTANDIAIVKHLLAQIEAEMSGVDTKVNIGHWLFAMIADALAKKYRARTKDAISATIQAMAPGKENDAKYLRQSIETNLKKLRKGINPARSRLLPPQANVLAFVAEKLPQKGKLRC